MEEVNPAQNQENSPQNPPASNSITPNSSQSQEGGNRIPMATVLIVLAFVLVGIFLYLFHLKQQKSKQIVNAPIKSQLLSTPSVTPVNVTTPPRNIIDCGTQSYDNSVVPTNYVGPGPIHMDTPGGLDCFIKASAQCQSSKLEIDKTSEIGYDGSGVKLSEALYFEIKSAPENKCELYGKELKMDFERTPSTQPQPTVFYPVQDTSPNALDALKKKTLGTEGSCIYNSVSDLNKMLSSWHDDPLDAWTIGKCSGNFDYLSPRSPAGG